MKSMFILLSVTWASVAAGGEPPNPGGGPEKPYYTKIEVKGDLYVPPGYKFDANAIVSAPGQSVAFVNSGTFAVNWELVIRDKKYFDLVKANGGKKVIVSGEAIVPGIMGATGPDKTTVPRYVILVTAVRLAESK